ncbi:hypothetical protein ACA910_004817 [Epithemia clementina (nom. ined.)]
MTVYVSLDNTYTAFVEATVWDTTTSSSGTSAPVLYEQCILEFVANAPKTTSKTSSSSSSMMVATWSILGIVALVGTWRRRRQWGHHWRRNDNHPNQKGSATTTTITTTLATTTSPASLLLWTTSHQPPTPEVDTNHRGLWSWSSWSLLSLGWRQQAVSHETSPIPSGTTTAASSSSFVELTDRGTAVV